MKISSLLSRYLSRSFLLSFGIGLLCIFFIILLFDFAELQRKSGASELSLGIKLNMIVLRAPHFLEQVIPFLSFGAAIFTFWKLNRSNELIILRASGLSLWKVIFPMSITGLIVGMIVLTGFNPLSTAMMERYEKLDKRHLSKSKEDVKIETTGLWLSEKLGDNQVIYRATKINLKNLEFQNLNIIITSPNDNFIQRIDAKRAQIKDGKLELSDGWDTVAGQIALPFDHKVIQTSLDKGIIEKMKVSKNVFSFWKLPSTIALMERSGLHSLKYRMQYYSMIASAFWVAAMILLAASFSCRPIRQGRSLLIIVTGLLVGFLLYFFKDMTFAIGTSGGLPPLIASWLPPLVTVMVGAALVFNQEDG